MLASLWRLLISRRLSVYLLALTVLMLVVGSLLPDLSFFAPSEALSLKANSPVLYALGTYFGLRAFTASWPFLGLVGFLSASVVACTVRRIWQVARSRSSREKAPHFPERSRSARMVELSLGPDEAPAHAEAVLRGRGWRVTRHEEEGVRLLVGRKGLLGSWGSIAFHLAMPVVAAGVLASSLTRFSGELVLAEGQTVGLDRRGMAGIIRESYFKPTLSGEPVRLQDFSAYYEGNRYPVDYRADLLVGGGGSPQSVTVRVNRPVDIGGMRFLMTRYGFSPQFRVVESSSGRALMDRYVNLVVFSSSSADSFRIQGTPWEIRARFFPDFRRRGGRVFSASVLPRNPVFHLTLRRSGREVARSLVGLGQSVHLGPLDLSFDDLRYWSAFQVTSDKGTGLLFAGIFAGLIGLGVRFLDPDRRLYVRITPVRRGVSVELAGKDPKSPSFARDAVEEVAVALESGPKVAEGRRTG